MSPRRLVVVALAVLGLGIAAPPAVAEQAGSQTRSFQAGLVDAGSFHSCAVTTAGGVRCWGLGLNGRLGYGNTDDIGDDEAPASAGDVPLGGKAVAVSAGNLHTCALLTTGAVRCWGEGGLGQLGYGNTNDIGDDETPASAGDVPLGGRAIAVSAGGTHTCAVLESGSVRCWGQGTFGAIGRGTGDPTAIGDDETPASQPAVSVGGPVAAISAGDFHTCAVLVAGTVRCWGAAGDGRLGYGNSTAIGDDETPASAGDVPVGGPVAAVSAGTHSCALLTSGAVRCWGSSFFGQLGYGNTTSIGDTETPASAGDVSLGGPAVAVSAGGGHTCAVLTTGSTRCFGDGSSGQLGYGNTDDIGDDELPSAAGPVPTGATLRAISASSNFHTCGLTDAGAVRCWGAGGFGRLGVGNGLTIGDNEPVSAGAPAALGAGLHGAAGDLAIALAAPATASAGVPYAATVTLTNSGPDAVTGVTVTAPGASGTPSAGTYDAASGVWTVGTVAPGASVTLTLARFDPAGVVALAAEVASAGVIDTDSTPGNGVATEDDRAAADVVVTAPAPPVSPPVVAPPPAVTPPTTTPTIRRVLGRLTLAARPRPRSRAVRVTGKLVLPAGTSRTACSGRVTVRLRRGRTTLATARVSLRRPRTGRTCTFAATVRPKARLKARQKLTITATVARTTRLRGQAKTLKRTVPVR